ncbi:MAG: hypothetical protein JSS61_00650 [Verrucomicrobia bacterium]|nr:hypothetical protein [Verrucomicrobiota bacterium]
MITLLKCASRITIPFLINPINAESRLAFVFRQGLAPLLTPPVSKPTQFSLELPAETKCVDVLFQEIPLTRWSSPFIPQDNYFLFGPDRICTLPLDRLSQESVIAEKALRYVDQDAQREAQENVVRSLNDLESSALKFEKVLKKNPLIGATHRMDVFARLEGLKQDIAQSRTSLFTARGYLETLMKDMLNKIRYLEKEKAQTYHGQECDVVLFETAQCYIPSMKAELEKIQEQMQYIE